MTQQEHALQRRYDLYEYTEREEAVNSWTHGLGILLSAVACFVLVLRAAAADDARVLVGCAIYSFTLVATYVISTLYHGVQRPMAKWTLRVADHVSIFALIAGSGTPFALVFLPTKSAITLLVLMWGGALAGTLFKVFSTRRFNNSATVFYLLTGWGVLLYAGPLIESVPTEALWWMAVGGIAYTIGVVFYLWDNLPYNHAIWHLIVIAASALHYVAIAGWVV